MKVNKMNIRNRRKKNFKQTIKGIDEFLSDNYIEILKKKIEKEIKEECKLKVIFDKELKNITDFDLFRLLCVVINIDASRWETVDKYTEKYTAKMKNELKCEVKDFHNLIVMIKNLKNAA